MVADDDRMSVFRLVSADGELELSLQMTKLLADEFRGYLMAQGFRVLDDNTRSVVAQEILAVAASPVAWTALGGAIVAFLNRHRGKVHRFEIEGESVSVEGYSARHARKLVSDILELRREATGKIYQDRSEEPL